MFARVQPQAVVGLSPHPSSMVASFQNDVGNSPCSQLLRDCEPAWPASHNDDVKTLNRHIVQVASIRSSDSSRGPPKVARRDLRGPPCRLRRSYGPAGCSTVVGGTGNSRMTVGAAPRRFRRVRIETVALCRLLTPAAVQPFLQLANALFGLEPQLALGVGPVAFAFQAGDVVFRVGIIEVQPALPPAEV